MLSHKGPEKKGHDDTRREDNGSGVKVLSLLSLVSTQDNELLAPRSYCPTDVLSLIYLHYTAAAFTPSSSSLSLTHIRYIIEL